MKVHELSTPAVVVELDILERNLERMASYCRSHDLLLRPHIKTHKSVEVAQKQLAFGAVGLTVAKVGEAEVMMQTGAQQLLVAHPIVGDEKLRRLAALASRTEILVSLDSLEAARSLSRIGGKSACTFGVLIEFDSGFGRCGVTTGRDCAELGTAIRALPDVRLRGLMTFFGSVWGGREERAAELARVAARVEEVTAAYRDAALPLDILSAGSTPAAQLSHLVPGVTEIRPGTYVYNDLNTYYQGLCALEECAVRVVTTVVSTSVPGHVIVDAGSKVFSSDSLGAGPKRGFGLVMEVPHAFLTKLNEEHGYIEAPDYSELPVGRVLSVVPNHVCACVNMHDQVFLSRSGEVIGCWNVEARGKVR